MSCLTCADPQKDAEPTEIEIAAEELHHLHVKAIHWHKQKVHHITIVEDARTKWAKNYSFLIFLIIVSGLMICEPFLIANDVDVDAQIGVQFASFAMMLIGTFFSMSYCDERAKDFSLAKKLYVCFDGQCQFELICLLYGIITLFTIPEYSAFRIIRCIRLMYYVEEFQPDVEIKYPEDNFFSPLRACRLTLMYMEAVAEEVLSERSKGGIVVLLMFFFQCFITGSICYYVLESRGLGNASTNHCDTLAHCYMSVMRLTFFDGNGFDLLIFSMDKNLLYLFWILIFHMVFTAIILLNGLIGIFGAAFNDVHNEESEDEIIEETAEDAAPPAIDLGPDGGVDDIKNAIAAQSEQIRLLIAEVDKLTQKFEQD